MYNHLNGRENHLVNIDRAPDYSVPPKGAPPAKVEKRKESENLRKSQKQQRNRRDLELNCIICLI